MVRRSSVMLPWISAAVPLAAVTGDHVVAGSFIVAAAVFGVSCLLRRGTHQPPPLPSLPEAPGEPAPEIAAPTPSPEAVGPYAAPVAAPPPLPPAAPSGQGSGRRFKVSTALYRPLDLVLIGVVFSLFFLMSAGGGGGEEEIPLEKKFTPGLLVVSILFQGVIAGMVMGFIRWRTGIRDWLGLRWRQWPWLLLIAPASVFFMWCVMGTLHVAGWNEWLERVLGEEPVQESVKLLQQAQDPLVLILMGVAAVIVAPLAEEIVFRGYLYPATKRFCGTTGAMVFSSLVFAAAHGSASAMLPLFLLALLLCLLYELTGSLWACISVHFLFNAATVTMQMLVRSGLVDIPVDP